MPWLPLAATGSDAIVIDLFVVLLAAKLGHELAARLGQPALLGEVLAGVLVGPAALGWIGLSDALEACSHFGVIVLLFWAGLETRLDDMRAVGLPIATAQICTVSVRRGWRARSQAEHRPRTRPVLLDAAVRRASRDVVAALDAVATDTCRF